MIVRSSQTVVASSIKLPSTPTSGARQLGTAIAVSPDHVCTVPCTVYGGAVNHHSPSQATADTCVLWLEICHVWDPTLRGKTGG